MNKNHRLGLSILSATWWVAATLNACAETTKMPVDTEAARIQLILAEHAGAPLLPELGAVPVAELAAREPGATVLTWAREASQTTAIPETTYTRYREFQRSGDRDPYQVTYFGKRTLLTQEVMAVWLGGDDSRLDRINDLIWSVCEETTWVLPAHERNAWTIDLFAAETGVELAHVLLLIGDRLPEEIRQRVRDEVKRRVLDLYLEHGQEYWWTGGSNNWTGVCAGSIGQTFLMFEDDPVRQARALTMVIEQLNRFIEHGFEEDGACLEGIGYWNYGLLHFVDFAEMLRARTGGAIDLLAGGKIRAIAAYPTAVTLGAGICASFADSHEGSAVRPFLAARLSERAGASALLGMLDGPTDWRTCSVLRNVLWWNGEPATPAPLETAVYPVSGIARLMDEAAGLPLVVAIKAGHNAEPHNHNDVGSLVVRIGKDVCLCDPGAGLYSRDYFSNKRYDNVFANSYGHSVPRIGGALQAPGKQHRGTLERLNDKTVQISFADAYDLPELKEAVRVLSVKDGQVVIEDRFRFDGAGKEVEEALLTWRDVVIENGIARIGTDEGTLEIAAAEGTITAERLEAACKANRKSGVLTRLTVVYPAMPERAVRLVMTFRRKSQ